MEQNRPKNSVFPMLKGKDLMDWDCRLRSCSSRMMDIHHTYLNFKCLSCDEPLKILAKNYEEVVKTHFREKLHDKAQKSCRMCKGQVFEYLVDDEKHFFYACRLDNVCQKSSNCRLM